MNIDFSNCGYRETWRLIQFVVYIESTYIQNEHDFDYGYDLHYDEPFMSFGFSTLYASDHDMDFDVHNNAVIEHFDSEPVFLGDTIKAILDNC